MTKSIKDQNRWQLWLAIVANVIALIMKAANVLPLGLAVVIVTVINGLLSPNAKARIVFLRWRHALPGHRAFSELAPKDPRIDMSRLKKACGNTLALDPDEQNKVWYRLYKTIEKHPSIEHVQRDFLLMRDYACFVALAIIAFSLAAFIELNSAKTALLYHMRDDRSVPFGSAGCGELRTALCDDRDGREGCRVIIVNASDGGSLGLSSTVWLTLLSACRSMISSGSVRAVAVVACASHAVGDVRNHIVSTHVVPISGLASERTTAFSKSGISSNGDGAPLNRGGMKPLTGFGSHFSKPPRQTDPTNQWSLDHGQQISAEDKI
jgi:hypothetical protein